MTYYQVLGLKQGADKKEIKKAYFKEIRKFPPEKEPEQFKKIREAYEYLMKDENREQQEAASNIEASFRSAYLQALKLEKEREYEAAIQVCLEVLHISKVKEFSVILARLYLLNGNTGKAIKEWEALVRRYPEELEYQEYLGKACYHRGWNKKALTVFEFLYETGYQSMGFYVDYIFALLDQRAWKRGRDRILEAVGFFEQQEKKEELFNEMNDVWYALIKSDREGASRYYIDDIKRYLEFYDKYSFWKAELMNSLLAIADEICMPEQMLEKEAEQLEEFQKRMSQLEETGILENNEVYLSVKCHLELYKLEHDSRIRNEVKDNAGGMYGAYVMRKLFEGTERGEMLNELFQTEEYQGMLLDIKLTFLNQQKGLVEQMQIIAQEYPTYAELLGDFVGEVLQGGSRQYLWNKYEKQYKKVMHIPANARLSASGAEEILFDSEENGTYRREAPKVGRNDPCPCGSGKKYKQCCGRR